MTDKLVSTWRLRNHTDAEHRARKEKCAFGICVVDGFFYVGTPKELDKLPVVIESNYEEVAIV